MPEPLSPARASWRRQLLALLLLACAQGGWPGAARAQYADRARLPWRSLETAHFRFLFPLELESWALPVAARFESVRQAVDGLVGYGPPARVTVVMDDPVTVSNGLTDPELRAPTILFLATPPGPRADIGDNPGWGEILSVHEYTHAAHATRPSRNPLLRLVENLPLLPLDFGPVALSTPRWALEGYATYVEGRVTGSGRPHGVWRAAVLRQWALEGKLPSYGGMSATGGYRGGSFAYLAGSAYLEWLIAQRGDSALPHVWRRLTARRRRSFAEAFTGVFGGTPSDLYDRFRVQVTSRALEADRRLQAAGLVEGDTVQALDWQTGDPALSADGSHMAIVLQSRVLPPRVVVWSTAPQPPDSAALRRRQRELAEDPEDVPAVRSHPPARQALATLWPAAGRWPYAAPRFLPDGEHILLTRFVPAADGSRRPDLFVWDWKRGEVRRVTRGAAIVSGDPTPDGAAAVAVRCLWGRCDLVRVDLAGGRVRRLAAGAPDVVWARPRVSHDGRRVAAAVQRAGRWGVVVLELQGDSVGAPRAVGPADGAQRYDPTFLPGDTALVVTSEAGGVPDLEVVGPGGGSGRVVTRVTGAAMAPEPAGDGHVYFLRLHAAGLDLARVSLTADIGPAVRLDSALTPVAPLPLTPGVPLLDEPLPAPHDYGLGPRAYRLFPSLAEAGGKLAGRLALASSDPVGRLGWLAQGALGRTSWQGASLRVVYRAVRPEPQLDLFTTWLRLPGQDARQDPTGLPERVRYRGVNGALALRLPGVAGSTALALGGSAGALRVAAATSTRALAWMDASREAAFGLGPSRAVAAVRLLGAAGATGGARWSRGVGELALALQPVAGPAWEFRVTRGSERGGGALERFALGGEEAPLFDPAAVAQLVPMPALPAASLVGRRMLALQGRLDLDFASAYLWAGRASESAGWQRVVGLEQEVATGPVPLLRIPGLRAVAGIGYTLDEKPHRVVRLYGMATLRP